jgi:hypothetical protein
MAEEGGDLVKALASLRADLQAAMAGGRGNDVQFGLGEIELTLQPRYRQSDGSYSTDFTVAGQMDRTPGIGVNRT